MSLGRKELVHGTEIDFVEECEFTSDAGGYVDFSARGNSSPPLSPPRVY
jgi:hypothetical protein